MRAEILRRGLVVIPVADREQQRPIRQEQQAAAGMAGTGLVGSRAEDHAAADESAFLVTPAPDGSPVRRLVALGEREVEHAIAREVRIECDVEQPAIGLREHVGRAAGQRPGHQSAVAHDAQAAVLLGDENVALGREGETPRTLQARDQAFEPGRALDDGTGARDRDRLLALRRRDGLQGSERRLRQAGSEQEPTLHRLEHGWETPHDSMRIG